MATAVLTITCGCNTLDKPQVFNNVADAVKHADATGHKLTGTVVVK